MSDIDEKLNKIDKETNEKIEIYELNERVKKASETDRKRREELEQRKLMVRKRITEIIANPNLELDEPKLWRIVYKMGNPLNPLMSTYDKTVAMTERQKMMLEETGRMELIIGKFAKIESVEEVSEQEMNDKEKIQLDGLKEKIKLIKTSIDPELDEKGIYTSELGYQYEIVETEMTLRQALLVTNSETRCFFKSYKRMKEEKIQQEEKESESSKITLKSIKEAIKNKFKIR